MTEKYGIKEYIQEYREALEEKPEKGKPNLIEAMRKKGAGIVKPKGVETR